MKWDDLQGSAVRLKPAGMMLPQRDDRCVDTWGRPSSWLSLARCASSATRNSPPGGRRHREHMPFAVPFSAPPLSAHDLHDRGRFIFKLEQYRPDAIAISAEARRIALALRGPHQFDRLAPRALERQVAPDGNH